MKVEHQEMDEMTRTRKENNRRFIVFLLTSECRYVPD
jgi:hypothetical protein